MTERGANNQTKAAGGGETAAKTLAQLINEYDPVNAKHKFEVSTSFPLLKKHIDIKKLHIPYRKKSLVGI